MNDENLNNSIEACDVIIRLLTLSTFQGSEANNVIISMSFLASLRDSLLKAKEEQDV